MSWHVHNGDADLAAELGLADTWGHLDSIIPGMGRLTDGFEDVGTVHLPTGMVTVEVSAMPAQSFRFTCTHFSEGEGYPERTAIIETGSGGLGEYWPIAEKFATGMVEVR